MSNTKPFLTEYFEKLRFDKNHHLGMGDIRITISQQEEIIEEANARIAELKAENYKLHIQGDFSVDLELKTLKHKIAELEKENESLKYWKSEKDEEAEAERVSLAVAEIEIEKHEATKEEQKEWFNAGGMAERIIWKDEIEKLESEIKKLREERDRFAIDFAKHFYLLTPTQRCTVHPPAGSGAGYGLYQRDISDILEQFKQQK